jgi:hypothetical protein
MQAIIIFENLIEETNERVPEKELSVVHIATEAGEIPFCLTNSNAPCPGSNLTN